LPRVAVGIGDTGTTKGFTQIEYDDEAEVAA